MDWCQIVDDHGEEIFRVAYRMVRSAADAEDVAQDVLLEAYQKSQRSGILPSGALLRRMATLRAIDRLRRRRHSACFEDSEIYSPGSGKAGDQNPTDVAERMRDAISRLPDREAEAFVLRHVEGMKNKEIAEILGITVSAVSTAIHRALKRLRENLAEKTIVE